MSEHKRPVDPTDALDETLRTLAATTEVDPAFAAQLEATLTARAQQLREESTPWWRRLFHVQPRNQRPLRLHPAVGVALVLLALLLFATPPVRATVWDWLYGFGLITETTVANRPFVLEPVTAGANRPLSIDEIRAQSPFAIARPTWLPTELLFTGGFIAETSTGTQVTLAYHQPQKQTSYPPDAPMLFILISDGAVANQPLLAQDRVIPVQIAGSGVGMYVHGGWRSRLPVTKDSATVDDLYVDDLYWDATADEAWLSWQVKGLNYLLYAQGLVVEQVEMVAMAESMDLE